MTAASATAQSKEPWVDSLRSAATSEVPSLQYYLDSLGYNIDVASDELMWETFRADSGTMTARLVLEVGNSATSAYFGYFPPSDPTDEHILFRGFNLPGDSIQVLFDHSTQIGFYMTPALPSVPQTWYTWMDYNVDGYDHTWVFATGEPNTYLVAFEDLPQNGDSDFQDLVVELTFENNNRPPVFDQEDMVHYTVNEGESLSIEVSATDPEGTIPLLFVSPELSNAVFTDHLNGSGTYEFNPDFDQAGEYLVRFEAYDGMLSTDLRTSIEVVNVNRAPYFVGEPMGEDTAYVGEGYHLSVRAEDPDGTYPEIVMIDLPPEAWLVDMGFGTAQLNYWPDAGAVGEHDLVFVASDGEATDTAYFHLTVAEPSKAPIISPIADQTLMEAEQRMLSVSSKNPNNAQPPPFLQALNMPNFVRFNPYAGHGTFFFSPDYTSSGEYDITVMAYNATDTSYLTFHLTVIDVNAQPFVFTDGSRTIYETDTLVYEVESFDADGTIPYLTAYLSASDTLAMNMTFTDLRDGTGYLTFIPNLNQGGPQNNPRLYYVEFRATDELDPDLFAVSLTVTIEVVDRLAEPVLDLIGSKNVREGELLEFPITYHDPTYLGARLSASPLPEHATFTDYENGHAFVSFRPDYFQAGNYFPVFRLKVGEQVVDSEVVRVTVINVNRPPFIFVQTDSVLVYEGGVAQVQVEAYDADSTIPILDAHLTNDYWQLAPNMTFVDDLNGVGVLTFAPDYSQGGPTENPGRYSVVFGATDSEDPTAGRDTPPVTFYVINVNPPPVLNPIGPHVVDVGQTLDFTVTATDPADGTLTLTTSELPGNAVFTDNGNGSGRFVFTPVTAEIGEHAMTFYASDGESTVDEEVTITVLRANSAPYFVDVPSSVQAVEWAPFMMTVRASDGEGDAIQLSLSSGPEGAVFTDYGDGTGRFEFTPSYTAVDHSYDLVFEVSDGRAGSTGTVRLNVVNAQLQVGQTGDDADILINGSITLAFSEPVDASTIGTGVVYSSRRGSVLQIRLFASGDHSVISVEPITGGLFMPLDTLKVTINHNLLDLAGYPLPQDFTATFLTGALVYPGDTNNDGVVDERDILPIGTYFGRVGPSRPSPGYDWSPRAAYVHGATSTWKSYKAVYADADGSGTVDADDICAISSNWGLTRQGTAVPAEPRPSQESLVAALGDTRVIDKLAAALADCPEGAGKAPLLEQLTSQSDPENSLPTDFALYQNYPNPFNAGTVISFALPEASRVTLSVYNMVGQRVATLIDQTMAAGTHNIHWDGRDDGGAEVASGVYFYRIETDQQSVSKRMLLLK